MSVTKAKREEAAKNPTCPKAIWGQRYTLSVMSFLGFVCCQNMRSNLNIAIVAMVNTTAVKDNETVIGKECQEEGNLPDPVDGEFLWDTSTQGLVLASFYYGFLVTQIPGGYLSEKIGPKLVLLVCVLGSALFTMLNPLMARQGPTWLSVSRAFQGVFEAPFFPSLFVIGSKWLPQQEKSFLMTFILSGSSVGIVCGTTLNGYISSTIGWEWAFYVPGILSCCWAAAWCILCYDSFETHPFISEAEKLYLRENVPQTQKGNLPFPPLLKICTSLPFFAAVMGMFGWLWGLFTIQTGSPLYLSKIQHFSLVSNGFISSLPFLLQAIISVISGFLCDKMIAWGKFSKTFCRKLFTTVGHMGAMSGLVLLCFADCNRTIAVVALCLAMGFNGVSVSGFMQSFGDISPNYSGTLSAISNTIGTMSGFIPPIITGLLTKEQTIANWRYVFTIGIGVYIAGALSFCLFASGEVQPWNEYWIKEEKDVKEIMQGGGDGKESNIKQETTTAEFNQT